MNFVDVTNQALAGAGTRSQITSMTDGSQEALYANLLYDPLRDFLLREGDYDFALHDELLGASTAGPIPWTFSYNYPTSALRIRQIVPAAYVALDPRPIEWNVIQMAGARRIVTKTAASIVIYTKYVAEDLWDPIFAEAFRRLLGSSLVFALENRIEASKEKLSEAISFAGIANLRDS